MEFTLGYAQAFLKVCALGVAIMIPIWALSRFIEARGRARVSAEAGSDDSDDGRS